MRERAIAEYRELLANDESLTAELFARLKGGMSTTRMPYGQRELGISLHRHFLMRQQYEPLANRSQILGGAFDKVAAAMLADPVLMDRVGMRERERRLALVSPGYLPPAINTRLDAFVNDDRINFVEYNAENLSSLMDQAGLNQVLFEIRALELLAERYRMRQFTPVASLLEALARISH